MAGLNAPVAPLVTKSSANIQTNVNNLKRFRDPSGLESAAALDSLQNQINALVTALANPGGLTELTVTDKKGAVIGWIGSRIVGTITYSGGWFKDLYIGGTGPADAVIVASDGEVDIHGAAIKLTSNGLETDINNETLPEWGAGVSLVSIDTSVANGDQSFIAPQAFGVLAWDGAAYASIASIGDAGAGNGFIQLNGVGIADQIAIGVNPATITVFDGSNTVVISASGVNAPLMDAAAYKVSGVAGVNLSTNVVTAVLATGGTLNYGSSLTVTTDATGVFGTPAAGQSNGIVVTSVLLNISSTSSISSVTPTVAAHAWSKGILTS